MKKMVTLVATLFISLMACSAATAQEKAPIWSLMDSEGNVVSSADFDGQPLMIHFWATWCPYCKRLQPELDRLHRKYKGEGLQSVAISFREDEDADPAGTLEERGIRISTLVEGDKVAEIFGVQGTPTTVFIDRTGHIFAQTRSSDPDDDRLELAVLKILESRP